MLRTQERNALRSGETHGKTVAPRCHAATAPSHLAAGYMPFPDVFSSCRQPLPVHPGREGQESSLGPSADPRQCILSATSIPFSKSTYADDRASQSQRLAQDELPRSVAGQETSSSAYLVKGSWVKAKVAQDLPEDDGHFPKPWQPVL